MKRVIYHQQRKIKTLLKVKVIFTNTIHISWNINVIFFGYKFDNRDWHNKKSVALIIIKKLLDVFKDALNYMPWLLFAVLFSCHSLLLLLLFNKFCMWVATNIFIKYFKTVFKVNFWLFMHMKERSFNSFCFYSWLCMRK